MILNAIARHFDVPITGIQVAGSAKTGRSFHKKQDFIIGESDLDVAVIDSRLFTRYAEIVFHRSRGYTDYTAFPLKSGTSTYEQYVWYLSRGMFRPDLMTVGPERAEWNGFFDRLSSQFRLLFKSINACVYLSEAFFESKQRATIKSYLEDKAI